MGTVHLGCLDGPGGFARIVAIKRLRDQVADQPDVVAMFLDEARLAASVRHPNVVPTFDAIHGEDGVLIVMEYVHGESLGRLFELRAERGEDIPSSVVSAIVAGVLCGLQAAHDATDRKGEPLAIVHRDVSPSNVIVGVDGIARVVDFGIAKAAGRLHTTRDGTVRGKSAYMAPEQLTGERVDRRADLWAAGVVLWEALTQRRLFQGDGEGAVVTSVLYGLIPPPSSIAARIPPGFDAVVLRALARDPSDRYPDARTMCADLVAACPAAPPHEVGAWVVACAHDALEDRAIRIAALETRPVHVVPARAAHARSRRRGVLAIAAVSALAAGLLAVTLHGETPPAQATRAPAPTAPPPALAPPPLVLAPAAVLPSAARDADTAATLTAPDLPVAPRPTARDATPGAAPRGPSRPTTATRAMSHRAPRNRAAPALDCDPPYRRDDAGHKIWKRECFKPR